jgi:hypothetical protein
MAIGRLEKCGLLPLAGGINLLGTFSDYVRRLIHESVIPWLENVPQPMTLPERELRFHFSALSDLVGEILRFSTRIPARLMLFCSGIAPLRYNFRLF